MMLNVAGVTVGVPSQGLGADFLKTFVDHFIVAFGSNRLQKTLEGKVAASVKKKKKIF